MNTKSLLSILAVVAFGSALPLFAHGQNVRPQPQPQSQPVQKPVADSVKSKQFKDIAKISVASLISAKQIAKGGGIDAGGGDGLEMQNVSQPPGVIVVPAPGTMDGKGTLELIGTPGAGQDNQFSLAKCLSNEDGSVQKSSCVGLLDSYLYPNQVRILDPGLYDICHVLYDYPDNNPFSNTRCNLIRVYKDSSTTLSLVKISLDNTHSNWKVRLFSDLTSPKMQRALLRTYFSSVGTSDWGSRYCKSKVSADENEYRVGQFCEAAKGVDELAFRGIFQFSSTGEAAELSASSKEQFERGSPVRAYLSLNIPLERKQFFSVLPGVYGIEFTNVETKTVESIYGIEAK